MRVLIVKTSSLGDLIHTFPAVTDAMRAMPDIVFDWVAEESFGELPSLHPAIDQVIPSAVRRWRKSWLRFWMQGDWKRFKQLLQRHHYDAVIDAQGLIKSALIAGQARGIKYGMDKNSARERQAGWFYDRVYAISREQHAISRIRELFSRALNYRYESMPLDYGLSVVPDDSINEETIIFLYGTTWSSKRWPLQFWRELAVRLTDMGKKVVMPAGHQAERRFAEQIARDIAEVEVLPFMTLTEMASVMVACQAVVAVDTGLAHLAAALNRPGVSLYGSTSSAYTGTLSQYMQPIQAQYACSPCLLRRCNKLPESQIPPCTGTILADRVADMVNQRGAV